MHRLEIFAAAEFTLALAQENDHVSRAAEAAGDNTIDMLEQTDAAHGWSWIDGLPVRLVVERHVPAGDWPIERPARLAEPRNSLSELPHDRRLLRVAKIQTIGGSQRLRASAGQVARRFRDREHRTPPRIEITIAPVAIERHCERTVRPLDAHHSCADARQVDRVGLDHVVVLAIEPLLAG